MTASAQTAQATPEFGARLVLRALLPFACGYFMSYLFRAVNSVIAPDLMAELGLTKTDLGLLTSAYLYAFMIFQLPLGLALDRFGPRRVQTVLLTLAAIGAGLFGWGTTTIALTLARAVIGIGLCGCLMSAFKANVLWLPLARVPLANSVVVACGGLGIVAATAPADLLAQAIGWRGLFFGLAALTFAVALFVCLAVPRDSERQQTGQIGPARLAVQLHGLKRILLDPVFWRIAPMVAAISGSSIAIQTLWAARWMVDIRGLDRGAAANVLMAMAIAFVLGSLSTGLIADWAGRRGIALKKVVIAGFAIFACAQVTILLNLALPIALPWIVFGLTAQTSNLGYATLAAHFGREMAGRAQSSANMLLFLASAVFQSGIGWVLDLFPGAEPGSGTAAGYEWAFGLLLVLQFGTILWYATGRLDAAAASAA